MIHQLDDTLKKLLDNPSAPDELHNADKSFVIPKGNYGSDSKTVNLFLYDLHEDRDLKQSAPIIERVGNSFIRKFEPLRFNCTYMVTAWCYDTSNEELPIKEHELISQTLWWLSRFSVIPEVLDGQPIWNPDWRDKTKPNYQPFPLSMRVAQLDSVKEHSEFWTALGTTPRLFFNLIVTIALDLNKVTTLGPEVSSKISHYEQFSLPGAQEEYLLQIGGRITNKNTGEGINKAIVMIKELGRTKTTDENGYYTFSNIPIGTYTFNANADGYLNNTRIIKIPFEPPDKDYSLELEHI